MEKSKSYQRGIAKLLKYIQTRKHPKEAKISEFYL